MKLDLNRLLELQVLDVANSLLEVVEGNVLSNIRRLGLEKTISIILTFALMVHTRILLVAIVRLAIAGESPQRRKGVVQLSRKELDPLGILVIHQGNEVAVLNLQHLHQRGGLEERRGPEVVHHERDDVVLGESPPAQVVGDQREEDRAGDIEQDQVTNDALARLVVDQRGVGIDVGGQRVPEGRAPP